MNNLPTSRIALTLLHVIEQLGLLVIVIATVFAGIHEVGVMIDAGTVTLADLLLMFLYLEILAMVGVYYRSGKLPVRFPIYIAIVALARHNRAGHQEHGAHAPDRRLRRHPVAGPGGALRPCPLPLCG